MYTCIKMIHHTLQYYNIIDHKQYKAFKSDLSELYIRSKLFMKPFDVCFKSSASRSSPRAFTISFNIFFWLLFLEYRKFWTWHIFHILLFLIPLIPHCSFYAHIFLVFFVQHFGFGLLSLCICCCPRLSLFPG